jgi:anti-anti-sigma factor
MNRKVETDEYRIWFESESATLHMEGRLRLDGMQEYEPVMNLLLEAVEQQPVCTLNLKDLEFLNSSGISMLSMFVVKVRNKGDVKLLLQGSSKILWQTKSLKNLQRLMPSIQLDFV